MPVFFWVFSVVLPIFFYDYLLIYSLNLYLWIKEDNADYGNDCSVGSDLGFGGCDEGSRSVVFGGFDVMAVLIVV